MQARRLARLRWLLAERSLRALLLPLVQGKASRKPYGFQVWCGLCPCVVALGVVGVAVCGLCATRRQFYRQKKRFFLLCNWQKAGVWPAAVKYPTLPLWAVLPC